MHDKIFIDDINILNWVPDTEAGDVESVRGSMSLLSELIDEHTPTLLLVDLTRSHRPNAEQRKIIVQTLKANAHRILKMAFFGDTPLMKAVSYFIINASGFTNVKFFSSRTKAISWLKEMPNP
jgi:hypothetical protein